MIKLESILILASLIIGIVNGHGCMTDPPSRALKGDGSCRGDGVSGAIDMYYTYRGGDVHVCGDNGYVTKKEQAQNTALTGSVTRTYTSGSIVTMNAYFYLGHGGYFRVKLCKLNSPSDIVSGTCLDQNVLRILSVNYTSPEFSSQGGIPLATHFDDATVLLNWMNDLPGYISYTVKLPDGLTCDNCVVLWDYHQQYDSRCKFINSSLEVKSTTGLENYGEALCPTQSFRNCADIKIVPAANPAAYVPNPVKPITTSYPLVFKCRPFKSDIKFDVRTMPNTRIDTLKYTGQGLFCLYYSDDKTVNCDICQSKCMTPDQVCPSNCYCRWFSRTPNVYT